MSDEPHIQGLRQELADLRSALTAANLAREKAEGERDQAREQCHGMRKELTDADESAKMHSSLRGVVTHVCASLTTARARIAELERERDEIQSIARRRLNERECIEGERDLIAADRDSLRSALDAVTKERDEARATQTALVKAGQDQWNEFRAEIASLRAQLAAANTDRELMDYLEKKANIEVTKDEGGELMCDVTFFYPQITDDGSESLRDAVRAAPANPTPASTAEEGRV